MSSALSALLTALVTLAPLVTRAHTAAATATMLRINTDKENLKIANRSLEFVKIIREDLRRNNDDYVADHGRGARQLRGPTWTRGGPPAPREGLPDRGALTHLPSNRIPLARDSVKRPTTKRDLLKFSVDSRRNLNATRNETTAKPNIQNATIFRSYSHPVKHYKKVRVDKLKRLVEKGKRLRLGRMPTEVMGEQEPANNAIMNAEAREIGAAAGNVAAEPSTGVGADVGAEGTLVTSPAPAGTTARVTSPAHEGDRARQAVLRQHAVFGSPAPDQLDMAPARGPQIQLKRFKGRLCQRSVLNMEGPVYDAAGSSVMPPYRPEFGRGRQFPNTRAPDMILPRCCNCCKKSVLGCQ